MSLLDELDIDPEDFTWRDLALCKDLSPVKDEDGNVLDIFYDGYESSDKIARQTDEMCLHCPVLAECARAGADGQWGVWGGIYWNGLGKPDRNRNSHKTPEVWDAIRKRMTE